MTSATTNASQPLRSLQGSTTARALAGAVGGPSSACPTSKPSRQGDFLLVSLRAQVSLLCNSWDRVS